MVSALSDSDVMREAHGVNAPVIVHGIPSLPAKPERSWYSVEGEKVNIEVVKTAESGKGTVVRLYETAGSTSHVTFKAAEEWKSAVETDLMEKPVGRPMAAGNTIKLRFGPYEIKTFHLT